MLICYTLFMSSIQSVIRVCRIIPLLIILFFAVFGCASSSGSLFEDMAEKDSEPSETEISEKPAEEGPGLYIESLPEDAEVYINGLFQGTTPVEMTDLDSGEYSLEVRKSGYKPEKLWINYTGTEYDEYRIELTELTGFLAVDVFPEDAQILLDGTVLESAFEEVQIGTYRLSVRAFGYEPFKQSVTIDEDETTYIEAVLPEADLSISELRLSKSIFNPENPGTLGSTTLRFSISKPGKGLVSVFSADAEPVVSSGPLIFSDWEQSFSWDGRDIDGRVMPDGSYTVFIEAEDEERTVTGSVEVVIDSSRTISYSSTLNGTAGLLYCPDTDILPDWASQLGLSFLGHIQTIDGAVYYRFPIQASLRVSPYANLELCAAGGIKLSSAAETPLSVSLSGKYRFANLGIFRMAVNAKGGFVSNDTEDTLTNYTGFSAGLPMELVLGPVHITASPEFIISPERVVYFAGEPYPEKTVYIWNYFRAGLAFTWKWIGFGFSAALRMLPYTEGFGIHWPIPAGAEFHFIIPNTQVVLLLQGGGEFSITRGYYIFLGLGAALLN